MKKNKLFKKLFIVNVVTVVVTVALLMAIISFTVGKYLVTEKKTLLTNYCKTVASSVTDTVGNPYNRETYWHNLLILGKVIHSDVFIVDESGSVIVCSCDEWAKNGSCSHSSHGIHDNALKTAEEGQYYELGTMGGMYGEMYHTVGMPITDRDGSVVYTIFASTPASLLEVWIRDFSVRFLISAILPLLLACAVTYFYTRHILRPINEMNEAAQRLAEGDFSKRIVCRGNDEIAELAESFNQMTNSLVQLEGMRRSFVANVSHELRTPMTTIGGFIDGILDGTIEPDKQEHYLRIVSEEAKRLSGIVRSMLSLARLESGQQQIEYTSVNLHALVCSVFISQEQRIESKNIEVVGLDNGENTETSVDKDLFYQVIYNLADNAVKFTNEGGRISVDIGADDINAHFTVRNTGTGIPEKDLPKVFERFYKIDKARSANKESSGLGLYIVKSVIDLHSGSITVRSKYGEYTEFEVTVPKCEKGGNNDRKL